MKKWKWGYGSITEIEVVRETPQTLVVQEKNWDGKLCERRLVKNAGGYRYFDTREEAVDAFRVSLENTLAFHERGVIDTKKKLESLK